MKTIGAKYLRQNMDTILDRVIGGEEIIVQHRFKKPVRLSPVNMSANKNNQKLAGLEAFEKSPKLPNTLDPNKSIKELYHESISDKYSS